MVIKFNLDLVGYAAPQGQPGVIFDGDDEWAMGIGLDDIQNGARGQAQIGQSLTDSVAS